jgi:hypothetical protein
LLAVHLLVDFVCTFEVFENVHVLRLKDQSTEPIIYFQDIFILHIFCVLRVGMGFDRCMVKPG